MAGASHIQLIISSGSLLVVTLVSTKGTGVTVGTDVLIGGNGVVGDGDACGRPIDILPIFNLIFGRPVLGVVGVDACNDGSGTDVEEVERLSNVVLDDGIGFNLMVGDKGVDVADCVVVDILSFFDVSRDFSTTTTFDDDEVNE
jgi:hypothetical protein